MQRPSAATDAGFAVFEADGTYTRFADFGNLTHPESLTLGTGTSQLWDTASSNSPRRVVFSEEESADVGAGIFYTGDFSDGDENIWRLNLDTNEVVRSYAPADRDPSTATGAGILGNVHSLQVIGSGATRRIYALDEDIEGAAEETLVRLDIGAAELFNGTLGTEVAPSANLGTWQKAATLAPFTGPFNFGWDFHILADCTSLIGGNTSTGNIAVFRLNSFEAGAGTSDFAGATPVWESEDDANSATLEADDLYGLAVDENRGVVYCHMRDDAGDDGQVYELDLATGAIANSGNPIITITSAATTGVGDRGGVAVDAAGNICVVAADDGFLRIFSPPDGSNSFATTTGELDFNVNSSARDYQLYR
jgi:hypothetical protein